MLLTYVYWAISIGQLSVFIAIFLHVSAVHLRKKDVFNRLKDERTGFMSVFDGFPHLRWDAFPVSLIIKSSQLPSN